MSEKVLKVILRGKRGEVLGQGMATLTFPDSLVIDIVRNGTFGSWEVFVGESKQEGQIRLSTKKLKKGSSVLIDPFSVDC